LPAKPRVCALHTGLMRSRFETRLDHLPDRLG
jgi:hypothetical protein